MRKHPILFLLGFAAGYLPVLFLLSRASSSPATVLADEPAPEIISVTLETHAPEETVEPVVLAVAEEATTPRPTESPTPAPPTPAPSTPSPTASPEPTPTPDVWSPPAIEPIFANYAGMYSVDKNILERLANCESHFNENAQNGDYLGMFQFSTSTWMSYRMRMGLDANPDLRTNIEESIKTAAYVIQQQGVSPWPSCLR